LGHRDPSFYDSLQKCHTLLSPFLFM
jgi:hypothetical protein